MSEESASFCSESIVRHCNCKPYLTVSVKKERSHCVYVAFTRFRQPRRLVLYLPTFQATDFTGSKCQHQIASFQTPCRVCTLFHPRPSPTPSGSVALIVPPSSCARFAAKQSPRSNDQPRQSLRFNCSSSGEKACGTLQSEIPVGFRRCSTSAA
jgi:hypothetical protein